MKRILILKLAAFALLFLAVGFFIGMEYKAYQVRKAFEDAFSDTTAIDMPLVQEINEEKSSIINASLGEDIILSTIKIKVVSSKEDTIINATFGSPTVANEGTKFVIVNLDVTNITKVEFDFDANLPLVDNKDREFSTYDDSIWSVDNYMNYRTLSPDIIENGVIVYQVPNDAESYSLLIGKAGTDEVYQIKLK